jgi:hypothetical protein
VKAKIKPGVHFSIPAFLHFLVFLVPYTLNSPSSSKAVKKVYHWWYSGAFPGLAPNLMDSLMGKYDPKQL